METVASTEGGTMKKKRNRSHKKTKLVPTNQTTDRCSTPDSITAQSTVAGKENNPATNHAARVFDHTSPDIEADTAALARKPSRRRKRKPKGEKDDQEKADALLEPLTVQEVFPAGHIFTQTVCQQSPKKPIKQSNQKPTPGAGRSHIDAAKYAGLVDIAPHKLFPAAQEPISIVQNITFDEIFPGPDVFKFDVGGITPGKLTFAESTETKKSDGPAQTIVCTVEGLLLLSAGDLFPNSPSVGRQAIESIPQEKHLSEGMKAGPAAPEGAGDKVDKTREEILAEREAKKAAKLAAKGKPKNKGATAQDTPKKVEAQPKAKPDSSDASSKIKKSSTDASICEKMKDLHISDAPAAGLAQGPAPMERKELTKAERKAQFEAKNPNLATKGPGGEKPEKPALTKAERRAIQEAQRAAKAEAQQAKKPAPAEAPKKVQKPAVAAGPPKVARIVPGNITIGGGLPPRKQIINLFNHLHQPKYAATEIVNSPTLHPAVTKLGIQYAEGAVVGSKARCLALLKVLIQLIRDYEKPPGQVFGRSLEETLTVVANHLHRCRPFSVSMKNALRHVKMHARQLDEKVSVSEQKECLFESIESYIRDQIEKAEEAICISVQEKIHDDDVILTYGCSSLVKHILEEANRRTKKFRVIIVNARPRHGENAMLEQLVQQGVKCTCVLINAISYVMPEVTKVLLSAHALLANGSVMSRVGTAQIALVAKSYNVPVLVCCETHKFTERVQTDAFVYNELGRSDEIVLPSMLAGWETITPLTILNLHYDVTPPELVTAVVTEVAILPCTSVAVILRIKPSDVAY